MEGRTTVVPSQNGREPVAPKNKGQWRGRNRRGNNYYGRFPSQEHYRQQRDSSDRKDGYNQPQRRGTVADRRPPSRSPFQSKDSRPEVVQDNPVTSSSTGSKKYGTSLNHLLNFKYAPRQKPIVYHSRSGGKKYTPFNKEQFIQANFQFVVCDSGDYTIHSIDPDVLVEWDLIEQVRIFSHEVPSCPICLYPPVAAKITRCGHIYCWSCILHYLSLSGKSWHKCPICYEAVHKKDLKSVVALESHLFSSGDTITMRLMKRAKNSVLVIPKAQWQEREFKPFGINDEQGTCYAKLLLASREEVLKQIITPEETALSSQLMEAKSEQSEEVCFIEVAIAEMKARQESLSESNKVEEEVRSLVESVTFDEADNHKNDQGVTTWKVYSPNAIQGVGEYEAAFSDDEGDAEGEDDEEGGCTASASACDVPSPAVEDTSTEDSQMSSERTSESASGDSGSESSRPLSPSPAENHFYYFYQAEDGQNIFLSPINARCMIKEYGSLESCPDTITAQILEMDAMSQSEALRKQYRFLSHLPLTCEFVICELDIKPPTVSKDTLNFFRGELQQRKQQRQKKLRVEKRRDQKTASRSTSSDNTSKFAGQYSIPGRSGVVTEHLDLASDLEFPAQTGQLAFSPPGNSSPSPFMQFAASIASQDEGYGTVAEAEGTSTQESLSPSPPSFAQALRSKKAFDTTKVTEKPQQIVVTRKPSWIEEDDGGDCAPVPAFQTAFTEALVAADWSKYEARPREQGGAGQESGGKKPKKNKKKLLFTTGSFMKYS